MILSGSEVLLLSAPDLSVNGAAAFSEVVDPRDGPAMACQLLDILTIAVCILCGEDDWVSGGMGEIRKLGLTA
ncbi:MAG: transposase family protein [Thermomicrobiales bacterium]|nr:transposase family protein [Thermomicrobiales bacterium]